MYKELFDKAVDRTNTAAEKLDACADVFGCADVIPMWVADMDFTTAPGIITALKARAEHGVFGYTGTTQADIAAIAHWLTERFRLEISEDWLLWTSNVVSGLRICVNALTEQHDEIVICTPVYGPFFRSVKDAGRTLREVKLLETDAGWRFDFAGIEAAFKAGARAFILCNPHNPIGRVWSRAELTQLAELAHKYNVLVFSDEIHAGFIFSGHEFTSMLSVMRDSIVLISATKSFNLAGLGISNMIVPDAAQRQTMEQLMCAYGISDGSNNVFGKTAQRVAYSDCSDWQHELCEYIEANCRHALHYIQANMPRLKTYMPEGTYLMWLDVRELGEPAAMFKAFCDAGVGLSDGKGFGAPGYLRLNVACPRAQLDAALECMNKAVAAI